MQSPFSFSHGASRRAALAIFLCLGLAALAPAQQKKAKTAGKNSGATQSVADFPTADAPWQAGVLSEKRKDFESNIKALLALPADQVKPHPAANDFPGLPKGVASPVKKNITIDTRIDRWHSTGLYALPGKIISVTGPGKAAGQKLEVRIGSHTDKLWGDNQTKWTRIPEIVRVASIDAAVTTTASPFGGLIYIKVPADCKLGEIEFQIDGGIPAPHFVLGKTKVDQWLRAIRNHPAPWAELECKFAILSVPSEEIRKLDDPTPVLQLWDKIVKGEDDLAAVNNRTSPERICFDRQISAGYMHSGYPFMAHLPQAKEAVQFDLLKKGNWGFFHELGHNHQKSEWTPEGTGEVTCNIFSMYIMETVCGQPKGAHGAMAPDKRKENMRKYFGGGADFAMWKKDPFLALILYYQLAEGFGWKPFTRVFAEYRDMPAAQKPKTEIDKHSQFMVRFSRAVNKNLGPLYMAWNIPVSDEAVASLKNLQPWLPEPNFPAAYRK